MHEIGLFIVFNINGIIASNHSKIMQNTITLPKQHFVHSGWINSRGDI